MKSTELRQTGSFISRICRLKLLLAPAAILLASPALWGQTNSEDPNSFGTLPQDAPTINNPTVACAPTAVIDGLTYLENTYDAANPGSQLFNNMTPAQLDTAAQVNTLATDMGTPPGSPPGTAASPPPYTLQQMLDGTQTYLNNNPTQVGLTMSMVNSWETTAPGATSTAQILANLIKMGQAVMVEVTPPPSPANRIPQATLIASPASLGTAVLAPLVWWTQTSHSNWPTGRCRLIPSRPTFRQIATI
jgi:hypothetical protein